MQNKKIITIQLTEVGEYTVTDMNLSTYESVICSIQKRPGLFDFDDILLDLTQEFPGEREDSLQSILAQVILLKMLRRAEVRQLCFRNIRGG